MAAPAQVDIKNSQSSPMKNVDCYANGSPSRISQHYAGWARPETLRELADHGAADLIQELIEAFNADTAPRLSQMREAITNANTKGLSSAAHTIKGSAQQMGASSSSWQMEAMPPASELVRRLNALE